MQTGAVRSLARFQDAFARALLAADDPPPDPVVAALTVQPAFAIYRNTVMKGCIDALQANFPAVARLVGEEWFRAAAAVHVTGQLPTEPSLLAYGAGFPGFLAEFTPAAEMPYLADVARLDRLWTEAHSAADGPSLDLAAIAGLDPEALACAVLHQHPAARWAWFRDAPIYTVWSRNREERELDGEFSWHGEGALLTRPHGVVRWIALDAGGFAFLEACARGRPIAECFDLALQANGDADLVRLLTSLLEAGAFSRLSPPDNPRSPRTTP